MQDIKSPPSAVSSENILAESIDSVSTKLQQKATRPLESHEQQSHHNHHHNTNFTGSDESFSELKRALANVNRESISSIQGDDILKVDISTKSMMHSERSKDSAAGDILVSALRLSRAGSGNRSATSVGEEHRASLMEKRKSLKLAKQASERNVPNSFTEYEDTDTTKPLAAVHTAISTLSRKLSKSHSVVAALGTSGTNPSLPRRDSFQAGLQQHRSSSQNFQKMSSKAPSFHSPSKKSSIVSIRRISQQSIGGGSSVSDPIPDFDFEDGDDPIISSGFDDSMPIEAIAAKVDDIITNSNPSLASTSNLKLSDSYKNLSVEEKKERRRLLIEEQQRELTRQAQGSIGKKSREDLLNEVFSIPLFSADDQPSGHPRSVSDAASIKSASIRENVDRSRHLRQRSESSLRSTRSIQSNRGVIVAARRSIRIVDHTPIILPPTETNENVTPVMPPQDGQHLNSANHHEHEATTAANSFNVSSGQRTSVTSKNSKERTSVTSEKHRERPVSFSLYPRKSIISAHSPSSAEPSPAPESVMAETSLTSVPLQIDRRHHSIVSIKKAKEGRSHDSISRVLMDAASGLAGKGSRGSLRLSASYLLQKVDKTKSPLNDSTDHFLIPDPVAPPKILLIDTNAVEEVIKNDEEDQPRVSIREQANAEYNQYLLLQQRHDSVNFIHQIGSQDLVYEQQALRIKFLGPHLLGGQIGKGAFGKVKEGICTESLQRVAVKVMAKKRVRKNIDGVIREIKLLRRLKHDNVVTLIDVFAKVEDDEGKVGIFPWFLTIEEEPIVWMFENGEEEEKNVKILKWYIVMEFCPCSLQTVLDHAPNHKIPLSDAHSYFTQLMHGISYLHAQKVIHRDIKPGNLLLTTDGIIKITDFGIAEIFDTYSDEPMNCTQFAGTHQFLSPEVITDELDTGYDGTKVDVWACGIVLFNLISGLFPFEFDEDPNILMLHEKIVNGEYVMPTEAEFPLDDLISKILQGNPLKRLDVEQVLSHPWVLSQAPSLKAGILTYHHSKEDLASGGKGEEITLIPSETTMLPYISQMYLSELEQHIKNTGVITDVIDEDESGDVSKDSIKERGKKIQSGLNWIKRHVYLKKHS